MLKITELAQHLHQLRHNRSGRAVGSAMNVSEVWASVLESQETSIDRIDVHIECLPRPIDGMFARVVLPEQPEQEIAAVYAHKELPLH